MTHSRMNDSDFFWLASKPQKVLKTDLENMKSVKVIEPVPHGYKAVNKR